MYQQRSGQPQRKRVRRERTRLQQQLQQLCYKKYADGACSNFCNYIKTYFSSVCMTYLTAWIIR